MSRIRLILTIAVLLFTLASFTSAASGTSFCKCTCFTNSTIIPLDGKPATGPASPATGKDETKIGHGTCADCNKKFCLAYNLPICKEAKDEDVFTTCFQRDSAKDEVVVFIFIFATVGLLLYAAIRPCSEKWIANLRERRSYAPISSASAEES